MKIRADVLEEFWQRLAVQEVELADPGPGEVLVRLVACGVCHTDMYTASGADPSGYAPAVGTPKASRAARAARGARKAAPRRTGTWQGRFEGMDGMSAGVPRLLKSD